MNNDVAIKKADFNLPRMQRSGRGIINPTAQEDRIVKTSYTISENLQKRLKMLSVEKGVSISALLTEAIEDVLAKNGK